MRRRSIITASFLVLTTGALFAAQAGAMASSSSGNFAVRGIGAQTCDTLTTRLGADRDGPVMEYLAAWTAGYLSHLNRATPATYDAMPLFDNLMVAQVVAIVCRSNSQSFVETVLAMVIASFVRGSIAEESEPIEVADGDAQATLRREVFRLLQAHLIEEGHLSPGADDGYYGPLSREGLRTYQQANGLRETGLPDFATLISVFANAGSQSSSSR